MLSHTEMPDFMLEEAEEERQIEADMAEWDYEQALAAYKATQEAR